MLATLFALVVVLQVTVVALLLLAFYHVIKQQGRLLTRIDVIEDRLSFVFKSVARLEEQVANSSTVALPAAPAETSGLAVGTPIAPFRFPDLEGNMVAWESFRGRRVLFVHWNPQCGFCDLIAPELAQAGSALAANNIAMLLLSYGDRDTNRKMLAEHGLKASVLLMDDQTANLEAFQFQGTPVAYLIDEQGNVARPLAVGSDKVTGLVKQLLQEVAPASLPPSEAASNGHHDRLEGLKAGTRAPLFTLPDFQGNNVSLESYRGRPVLLVFTDPQCGPCDQLVPHLESLQQARQKEGFQVLLVGRGDPKANRQKAEQYNVTFPVLVQERKWTVAKQYGTLATPAAFLINAEGVVIRDVVTGLDAIVALAGERTLAQV